MKACLRVFAAVFALFFLFGNDAPVVAAPVSKLGIYAVDTASMNETQTILDACPLVFKVQDPHLRDTLATATKTYKTTCGGTVIMRVYVADTVKVGTGALTEATGKADADTYWQNYLSGPVSQMLSQGVITSSDYVAGPNEYDNTPDFKLSGAPEWYAGFWTELAAKIKAAGALPLMGEIPEGNIDTEKLDVEFAPLLPALKAIKDAGGAWSYHAYGVNKTPSETDEEYHALRYRKFYAYAASKGAEMPPLFITEVGLLRSDSAFSVSGDQDVYKAWIAWFDEEIKKDSYVLGATIFQIGSLDAKWSNRDVSSIAGWFAGYVNGNAEVPVVTGQPDPNNSGQRGTEKGLWGSIVSSLLGWVNSLTSSDVPKDIKNINNSGLPPRSGINPDEECDDEDVSAAMTAHRYNSKAAQIVPTIVPEQATSWWNNLIFGDIFDKGGDASQTWVDSGLPPGTGESAAYRGRLSSSSVTAGKDSNVLAWFGWFTSKEERMQQGVCEKRKGSLPPGLCCDDQGRLYFCGSNDRQPQTPAPTPDGSTTSGGFVGACLYLDEQDPNPEQAAIAQANNCSYQKLLPYFGNDVVRAKNASQICLAESGGNEINNNLSCLPENGGGTDYSIGLFQINLLWHCSSDLLEKFSDQPYTGTKFTVRDVIQFTGRGPTNPCIVKDWDKLRSCQKAMENPVNNIRKAASMSGGGTNWNPWSTAKKCGLRDWVPGGTGGYTDNSLVYYSQRQPEYAGEPFDGINTKGVQCTINYAGCGIVTAAMIISSLTDHKINPIELKNKYYANQSYCASSVNEAQTAFRGEGLVNHHSVFWADPSEFGSQGAEAGDTLKNEMRNNLLPGCALFTLGTINGIGHFWWIPKIDTDGTIYTMDPWYGWNRIEQKPYAIPMTTDHIGATVYFRSVTRVCK